MKNAVIIYNLIMHVNLYVNTFLKFELIFRKPWNIWYMGRFSWEIRRRPLSLQESSKL